MSAATAQDADASVAGTSQHPPGVPFSAKRPWAEHPRADVCDKAFRRIAKTRGYGLYFPALVESLHGREAIQNTSYDYQHLRQFVRELKRDGYIRIERVGPHKRPQDRPLLLYPTEKAEKLTVSKSSRRGSADGGETGVDVSRVPGSLPRRAPGGRAAQVARRVLRDRCQITPGKEGEGVRGALRHALAAHREGVDTAGMRGDRVSEPSRVAARQAAYLGAFEAAARRYRQGVLLMLSARPGESGDMVDTAVAVNESVDPLRDHLRRQTPGRGRPPCIVVREVTDLGVLHLHAVVFGVGPGDIDRDALGRYWYHTREHGYIVDVAPIERQMVRTARVKGGRKRRWVFGDHADAPTDRGRYVRSYLGDGLFRLREVAEASADELHAGAVEEAWKTALVWACGLPLVSISSGLAQAPGTPGAVAVTSRRTGRIGGSWRPVEGHREGRDGPRQSAPWPSGGLSSGKKPPPWWRWKPPPNGEEGVSRGAGDAHDAGAEVPHQLRRRRPVPVGGVSPGQ